MLSDQAAIQEQSTLNRRLRHGCSPACLELGRATLLQGPCEDAGNDESLGHLKSTGTFGQQGFEGSSSIRELKVVAFRSASKRAVLRPLPLNPQGPDGSRGTGASSGRSIHPQCRTSMVPM